MRGTGKRNAAIRAAERPTRPGEYTVFGDETDDSPLGLMYEIPLGSGWRFCPYSGMGEEIVKPTREELEASIQRRWNHRRG